MRISVKGERSRVELYSYAGYGRRRNGIVCRCCTGVVALAVESDGDFPRVYSRAGAVAAVIRAGDFDAVILTFCKGNVTELHPGFLQSTVISELCFG